MVAALVSSAFAADVVEKGSINKPGVSVSEVLRYSQETTVKYSSIKGEGVRIRSFTDASIALNLDLGSIDAGGGTVDIATYNGNIALGDVQGNFLQISTNKGNITIAGNVQALNNTASTINISSNGEMGTIVFDGATVSGVAIGNTCGSFVVNGNTALKDVCFEGGGVVEVAAGASLTLDNVLFAGRDDSNKGNPAQTGLSLGDNATLTINAGDDSLGDVELLKVKDLTIGKGVDIVITLSNEKFEKLEDSEIKLFAVENGTVDFSNVTFTFTNGEQYKTGNITSTGGTIFITDVCIVPEPTTTTLSLLALAGLAARRRRK